MRSQTCPCPAASHPSLRAGDRADRRLRPHWLRAGRAGGGSWTPARRTPRVAMAASADRRRQRRRGRTRWISTSAAELPRRHRRRRPRPPTSPTRRSTHAPVDLPPDVPPPRPTAGPTGANGTPPASPIRCPATCSPTSKLARRPWSRSMAAAATPFTWYRPAPGRSASSTSSARAPVAAAVHGVRGEGHPRRPQWPHAGTVRRWPDGQRSLPRRPGLQRHPADAAVIEPTVGVAEACPTATPSPICPMTTSRWR